MGEFVNVMNDIKRMCNRYINNCVTCPLSSDNNETKCICENFIRENPEKAKKIIEEWSKENPIITNADKFKEVFGHKLHATCYADRDTINNCSNNCMYCPYYFATEYNVPEVRNL